MAKRNAGAESAIVSWSDTPSDAACIAIALNSTVALKEHWLLT
jgi:hypothetical protein